MDGCNHGQKNGMRCSICDGDISVEGIERWQKEKLQKCGFYIHCVDSPQEGYINAHTHGFKETWGHPDFQIVLRLPEKVLSDVFWNFAGRVKKGEVFCDGMKIDEIIRNYPVLLSSMKEGDRDVLRVIFPDAEGRFPGDPDVLPAFEHQACIQDFYPDSN